MKLKWIEQLAREADYYDDKHMENKERAMRELGLGVTYFQMGYIIGFRKARDLILALYEQHSADKFENDGYELYEKIKSLGEEEEK